MTRLRTTHGPLGADQLGMILPHEHVFVDFRVPDHPEHARAEPSDVVALMVPEVRKAAAAGVTAMVDCTPVGVGRRVDIVKAVAEASGMPMVLPTGVYREPWVPGWAKSASVEELSDWMLGELQDQIEGTGVQAGWIKLSVGDDGITECESRILTAAARAGRKTDALIGAHTARGRVVLEQLDILEAAGYTADRFVWIHAQKDPDFGLHREVARRGAWLEYDGIGAGDDEYYLTALSRAGEAGLLDRVMLSQDRGWFDPAKPGGGTPQPFTYLVEEFLPRLRAAGLTDETIHRLTHTNPYRAFAR